MCSLSLYIYILYIYIFYIYIYSIYIFYIYIYSIYIYILYIYILYIYTFSIYIYILYIYTLYIYIFYIYIYSIYIYSIYIYSIYIYILYIYIHIIYSISYIHRWFDNGIIDIIYFTHIWYNMRRQYMYIYVYVYVRRYYCCLDVKLVCADLDLRRIDVYLSCGMKALGDFRWGLDGLQHSRQKTRIPHRCFKGLWRTDAEQFQRKKHSISFSFAIYPRVNSHRSS